MIGFSVSPQSRRGLEGLLTPSAPFCTMTALLTVPRLWLHGVTSGGCQHGLGVPRSLPWGVKSLLRLFGGGLLSTGTSVGHCGCGGCGSSGLVVLMVGCRVGGGPRVLVPRVWGTGEAPATGGGHLKPSLLCPAEHPSLFLAHQDAAAMM